MEIEGATRRNAIWRRLREAIILRSGLFAALRRRPLARRTARRPGRRWAAQPDAAGEAAVAQDAPPREPELAGEGAVVLLDAAGFAAYRWCGFNVQI